MSRRTSARSRARTMRSSATSVSTASSGNNSSSLMSLSSSFVSSLQGSLAVELNVGTDDGWNGSSGSMLSGGLHNGNLHNGRRGSGSGSIENGASPDVKNNYPPPKLPPTQFVRKLSHGDRSELVANSDRLKKLLAEEVQKSGVVTTWGYNAVLQKFLLSEEVEKEMCAGGEDEETKKPPAAPQRRKSSNRRQQQGGLMGRLVSSFTGPAKSDEIALGVSLNRNRRRSMECAAPNRDLLLSGSMAANGDLVRRGFGDDGEDDNIAPAKMKSFKLEWNQRLNKVEGSDDGGEDAGTERNDTANPQARQDSMALIIAEDSGSEGGGGDPPAEEPPEQKNAKPFAVAKSDRRRPSNPHSNPNRRGSTESLCLEDVFDGAYGSRLLFLPKDVEVAAPSPFPAEIEEALSSMSCVIRERDASIPKRDASEEGTVTPSSKDSDSDEDSGSCGWLPWPDRETVGEAVDVPSS